jgi:rSAM/selenodomain-associated transferase 1
MMADSLPLRTAPTLIVFARKPVKGKVKTRLAKVIGCYRAMEVYRFLLMNTLSELQTIRGVRKILMVAEPLDVSWFRRQSFCRNWIVRPQTSGNLGRRMDKAFTYELRRSGSVVLVGSDIKAIKAKDVIQTFTLLGQGVKTVIGPALDGGYWLLGRSNCDADIFDDIKWGGSKVFSKTKKKLDKAGSSYREINQRTDIDSCSDLDWYFLNRLNLTINSTRLGDKSDII